MTARAMSLCCCAAALVAIVYVAETGDRWPLSFLAVMVVASMVIGVGEVLLSRAQHDELQQRRRIERAARAAKHHEGGPRDGR